MYNTLNNEAYQDCGKCLFPATYCITGEPGSHPRRRPPHQAPREPLQGGRPDQRTRRSPEYVQQENRYLESKKISPTGPMPLKGTHSRDISKKTQSAPESCRNTEFTRAPKKWVSGDADCFGVRRYAGAAPQVGAGKQTLLNTSSFRYMNPLPRGEKVNEPGAAQALRDPHLPPTYKRPPHMSTDALSLPPATSTIDKSTIAAQNPDMRAPDPGGRPQNAGTMARSRREGRAKPF